MGFVYMTTGWEKAKSTYRKIFNLNIYKYVFSNPLKLKKTIYDH